MLLRMLTTALRSLREQHWISGSGGADPAANGMTMAPIRPCDLPKDALLRRYLFEGCYVDCYLAEVSGSFDQEDYVEAFYTTAVFKLERLVLAAFVDRPSTDAQARALARAERSSFAAWSVEARDPDQLLLCDLYGRTRSWLMSAPVPNAALTRVFFGSAIVPALDRRSGQQKIGWKFRALLGFHKLYSRVLLAAAARRLARSSARLTSSA
jgi:hypothetical protein